MSDSVLLEERDGALVTLTLNRPGAMNALSLELREALAQSFRRLQEDGETRVVILTGAGRAFCAGYDLKELAAGTSGETADSVAGDMADAIAAFEGPIVAAINGHAITGGFELALACDVLIASEAAKFADTHARVGILPGWGLSQRLPRLIGESRAKEISLTGNFIPAEQALAWGLVNHVLPAAELLPRARELAADMASCLPGVLRGYKRLIDDGLRLPLAAALEMEKQRAIASAAATRAEDVASRRSGVLDRGRSEGG
jgi:enoyl-CoA hydratase